MAWFRGVLRRISWQGRIRPARPAVLAVVLVLPLLALLLPYRWLFFLAYAYLLICAIAFGWVWLQAPGVVLRRRARSEVAQAGDAWQAISTWQPYTPAGLTSSCSRCALATAPPTPRRWP